MTQKRAPVSEFGQTGLQSGKCRFIGPEFVADTAYLGHHGGSIFLFAFQNTDLFGKRIAARLHFFRAGLELAAFRFQ